MEFSYSGYFHLVDVLREKGYSICSYDDCDETKRGAILRHDIDYSLEKARKMAVAEGERSIRSTYLLLVSCDFYSVFSLKGQRIIDSILDSGHEIGLHFDECRYPEEIGDPERIKERIIKEAQLLSMSIGRPVTKVSMHRPSKNIIESDLSIPGIINTYSKKYFEEYKYVSDSRRRWREPIEQYISDETYDKFQILVHPIWYNETEITIDETVRELIIDASYERYDELNNNIKDLDGIIKKESLFG